MVDGRDKSFIIRELVQNAWDEPGVTFCRVDISKGEGGMGMVRVSDDAPEGFYDLRFAYTIFARTRKRVDAGKRGRFNIGDKQVLALCDSASVTTTTGTVIFLKDGTREQKCRRREAGSEFLGMIRMTEGEINKMRAAAETFIPPAGIETVVNGITIKPRDPLVVIPARLLTEYENAKGEYRESDRNTTVRIYDPLPGEKATIYEMGLPVMETGDRWHYDVQQRVPLTIDRNNVRPSFLRDLRAVVLNALAVEITADDAAEKWVRDGTSDPLITPETVKAIADVRWGEKRVVLAPGDTQSREKAILGGYRIVSPSEMSADEWSRFREAGAVPSGTDVFGAGSYPETQVPEDEWTREQRYFAGLAQRVAEQAMGVSVTVRMYRSPKAPVQADYTALTRTLRFNLSHCTKTFEAGIKEGLALIIHELAHERGGHLERGYQDAICEIGAALAVMINDGSRVLG